MVKLKIKLSRPRPPQLEPSASSEAVTPSTEASSTQGRPVQESSGRDDSVPSHSAASQPLQDETGSEPAAESTTVAAVDVLQGLTVARPTATAMKRIQRVLGDILDTVSKHESALLFREPVDAELVPDYYDVIAHPMDLGTMRERVAKHWYVERVVDAPNDGVRLLGARFPIEDVVLFLMCADLERIVRNCLTYNKPHTQVAAAGKRLLAVFWDALTVALGDACRRADRPGLEDSSDDDSDHDDSERTQVFDAYANPAIFARPVPESLRQASNGPTMWPRGRPLQRQLRSVVNDTRKLPHAVPFLEPVEASLREYFEVVRAPMDLSTVSRRLDDGAHYRTIHGMDFDMALILFNCATFNNASSPMTDAAEKVLAWYAIRRDAIVSDAWQVQVQQLEEREQLLSVDASSDGYTDSDDDDDRGGRGAPKRKPVRKKTTGRKRKQTSSSSSSSTAASKPKVKRKKHAPIKLKFLVKKQQVSTSASNGHGTASTSSSAPPCSTSTQSSSASSDSANATTTTTTTVKVTATAVTAPPVKRQVSGPPKKRGTAKSRLLKRLGRSRRR